MSSQSLYPEDVANLHHIIFPTLAFCKILHWANPSNTAQIVWCVSEREAADTAFGPTSNGGFASNYHRLPNANGCLTTKS
ncbi:hypothetical protein PCASD_19755 [Puccinia coronata f. sp. avenae]|uniref:Uncharacterized protein n=1 Tax=Puccinia coronata f. sp. avenae TaxID=200324 RepID=A0A2N5TUA8_9BASI|nr:hypothetical protein PCASD_19755 [Puccinia coronata f. sp. avenae]